VHDTPQHFLFFTDQSLHFFCKARPVDIIYQTLATITVDGLQEQVAYFQAHYGAVETICCLLQIALNRDSQYLLTIEAQELIVQRFRRLR